MAPKTPSLEVLPLTARGKVRDLYYISPSTLLFVATDRISAFDLTLSNEVPSKGEVLTLLTLEWYSILARAIPSLRTHFLTTELPPQIPKDLRPVFARRSMQVRRLKVFPIEAIVRGYITGSAWAEYMKQGTVHGMKIPEGMQEGQKFAEPLFTPSTKAPPGEKDENIHPSKVAELVGSASHAARIEELALKIYSVAQSYAVERGIIIADTKFEFGLDEETDEVVLVDEVLTPDSSRFWDQKEYIVGKPQKSLDKQPLRNWLTDAGLKGHKDVEMPDDIVQETAERYRLVYERLAGKKWEGY